MEKGKGKAKKKTVKRPLKNTQSRTQSLSQQEVSQGKDISKNGSKPQRKLFLKHDNPRGTGVFSGSKILLEEWVETFYKVNESLSLFKDGDYTQKLSTIIPYETLQKLVRTYRLLNRISTEEYFGDDPFRREEKDIKKAIKNIDNLVYKKILSKQGALQCKGGLVADSFLNFLSSSRGLSFFMNTLKPQIGNIGTPKNIALDFLVYCVIYLVKSRTRKPNYKLIVDFLEEQNIINSEDGIINEEVLRKRYTRIKVIALKNQYNNLKSAFLITLFCIKERIPYQYELADLFIPPIEKFITS